MVFLDANILLELILTNRSKTNKVEDFLSMHGKTYISMLTVHLVMHFGILEKIKPNTLFRYIDQCAVLDLTPQDYLWAKKHCTDNDFEDALQVAVAVRSRCKEFVTLDKTLAKNYKKHINMILL